MGVSVGTATTFLGLEIKINEGEAEGNLIASAILISSEAWRGFHKSGFSKLTSPVMIGLFKIVLGFKVPAEGEEVIIEFQSSLFK